MLTDCTFSVTTPPRSWNGSDAQTSCLGPDLVSTHGVNKVWVPHSRPRMPPLRFTNLASTTGDILELNVEAPQS